MTVQFRSILQALSNYNHIEKTNSILQQQLTTGKKINSPSDNPSMFSRITRFQTEISSYDTYLHNIDEGSTVMSLAKDATGEQLSVLQQMLEVAGNAMSSGVTSAERSAYNTEYQKLYDELDEVVNNTTYNSQKLLDGTFSSSGMNIATGPGQSYTFTIDNTTVSGLNSTITSTFGPSSKTLQTSFNNQSQASNAYDGVQNAISVLTDIQAGFGTDQFILDSRANLMESKQTQLETLVDNYQEVDLLQVSAQLDQNQIIQQYALAAIASMNQSQQNMVDYLFPRM